MNEVRQLFAEAQPGPAESDVTPSFIETARAVASICATRMLLMIAVVTGCGVWAYTVADPTRERLYAAVAYSLVFVLPQVALFWKRG